MMRTLYVTALAVLAACTSPATVETGDEAAVPAESITRGIRWTAAVESFDTVRPGWRVTVRGRNTARTDRELYYGACNVTVRLFRSGSDAAPVWDSSRRPVYCILPLYHSRLAVGDSISFGYRVDTRDVVSDSVPAGEYFVTARAFFSWDSGFSERGGTGELAAGYVFLKE